MIEDLVALGSGVFVGEVYECRVEYHLVEGQVLLQYQPGEFPRIVCGDIGCLAFGMLGVVRSFDGFVEDWAAVAGDDGQGFAVCAAQGLEDGDGKGADLGGYAFVGDAVVDAEVVGGLAPLEFLPGEVFADAAGVGCIPATFSNFGNPDSSGWGRFNRQSHFVSSVSISEPYGGSLSMHLYLRQRSRVRTAMRVFLSSSSCLSLVLMSNWTI